MAILTIRNSSCTEPQGGWVEYGLLYNGYAVTDVRNIANVGWYVPSRTDFNNLFAYNGGRTVSGKLKETGFDYWDTPNSGATDAYDFSARGGGERVPSGFRYLNIRIYFHTSHVDGTFHFVNEFNYSTSGALEVLASMYFGNYVRLVSDATGIPDGTKTTYTGNDGKIYKAVAINGLYWLSENLAETKYRNGDVIPEVTDNTTWSGLTTGALCSYNNDWTYSGRTKPSYY